MAFCAFPTLMLLALQAACASASLSTVFLDDFRSLDAWSVAKDGGIIEIARDDSRGKAAMRLHFPFGRYQWGNAQRAATIPPNATAIEFDLFVTKAESAATLFLWLFEKDGDGLIAVPDLGGKSLREIAGEWRHCSIPLSKFRFEPRGNGLRALLDTSRLLIGMNNGEADVLIANLGFQTADRSKPMTLARTQDLRIQDGAKGRIGILADSFPVAPSNSDPNVLAETLRACGYGVTPLGAGEVADPGILTRANFDCLILPYGPHYPYAASDAIKAYLKSGGCFLSTGGYAFDAPCVPDSKGALVPAAGLNEVTAEDLAKGDLTRGLNTRHGKPGDTMGLDPDQIGVFDPAYHLNNASFMQSAAMQHVIPATFKAKTPVTGYAACSLLGSNSPVFPEKWGRHISLVNACDSRGRSVGPVGSIARNYAGPYVGSSWAFFGATNLDLFAKDGPMLPYLGQIVDSLVRNAYLHSLATDMACYRDGEWVIISCKLANHGRAPFTGRVSFSIYDRNGKLAQEIPLMEVSAEPGQTTEIETEWRPLKFDSDLYRIVAKLSVGGEVIDAMETGVAAHSPKVIAGGLKLKLKNNYFCDGDRPVLLSGTNVTGAIFFSANENPLVWDRDLQRVSDCGVNILRVLHFSPFMSDTPWVNAVKPLDLAIDKMPTKIERQLDALVQLCQKHKIVLFLTLHDWMPVELTDKELDAQRTFAELIARRYKDVPGFMIDIQNEPHVAIPGPDAKDQSPDIVREWNDFLRAKYGTDDALREAWRISPPECPIGSIAWRKGTDAWDDMRTFDADAFRDVLVNRWTAANASGVRAGDPDMPVTVGFLQEYFALNKLACMDKLDFANMHSYTGLDVLRADLKLFDRRFEGKSLSLGEFGSVVDHNKRVEGADVVTQDWNRFLQTGHYVFGLGGSFLANWSWKDMDDVVFPWGINYQNEGPRKDIAKAYRNQSLLFRQVRPVYKPPSTFLVVPTNMMLGGQSSKSLAVLYYHVHTLADCHMDFATIDEEHLGRLPSSAKLLVYPIPFSVPDRTYEQLTSFVSRGGKLLVTGDLSYDSLRRRTHADRLQELCGVRFASKRVKAVNWRESPAPCIDVEPESAKTDRGVFVHKMGRGYVYYTADPRGITSANEKRPEYPELALSVARDQLPDYSVVQAVVPAVFRVAEANGGWSYTMVNAETARGEGRIFDLDRAGNWVLTDLAPGGTGFARFDSHGSVLAAESQGPVVSDQKTIPMQGHWALISCDGKDVTDSREMIVLPFGGGEIDLGNRTPANPKSAIRNPQSVLVVQTGDVVGGKWRVLSESTNLKIKASGADAFDIRIVAPRSRLAALGARVASELTLSGR